MVNTQVDPELARAAVEAVSKWRYSPKLLNGDPIEVDMTVVVNFKLLPYRTKRNRHLEEPGRLWINEFGRARLQRWPSVPGHHESNPAEIV